MVFHSGVIVTMRNIGLTRWFQLCNSYMHPWTESDVHLSSSLHGRPTTLIICWTWATISTGVASLENVARRPCPRLMTWPERSSTGLFGWMRAMKHIRKRDCHLISSCITINCTSCKRPMPSYPQPVRTSWFMEFPHQPAILDTQFQRPQNNPIHPCWGSTKMSTKVQVWTENLGYQC